MNADEGRSTVPASETSAHAETTPSQTALMAAAARAAHLIVDNPPVIFADTLAMRLLGDQAEALVGYHRAHGDHLVLSSARAQVICRSRYTEDHLAAAVADGVTQYVLLGAGLDTFAYRGALAGQVRVFEVDHPATQRWKRDLLAAAGIELPACLTFVPADLEHDSLRSELVGAGLDPELPAFVSWLGVTLYLTESAITRTFSEAGGLAPGTQLVADYMLPAALRDEAGDSYVEQVAPVAAQHGEPWLTFLAPQDVSALLEGHSFGQGTHVAQADIGDSGTWHRTDSLRPIKLSMIAHATVQAPSRSLGRS
jgi:methyltransferase (TIGR00027 family)